MSDDHVLFVFNPSAGKSHFIRTMAKHIGAVESQEIPGLWYLPGKPELTENQVIQVWHDEFQHIAPVIGDNWP